MILLTGFEPFDGLARNPTGDLARALAGGDVEAAVLPVDYDRVGAALAPLLAREWDAVVLLGVAVRRPRISIERVAINLQDPARPDNAGAAPGGEVVPGGPAAYFSTLPVELLHDRLAGAGLPVELSLSAGAYLCNASFYRARHALEARGTPCGFIHMPPTEDLGFADATLPEAEQIRALGVILDTLRGGSLGS